METELIGLIRRAQNGDARAFDRLVRRYQGPAIEYARAVLADSRLAAGAAEDVAQEAFLQAWRDLPQLREPAAFPPWLRRILFKYCDRARRTAARRVTLVPLDAAGHIAGGPEPGAVAEAADDAARIRAALDALPDREREAALLYYLGGRDLAEIAAALGAPRTTIKNRLHAARKRLRKELSEMAEESKETIRRGGTGLTPTTLARILAEFRQQMRADPHAADRALLRQAREKLDAILSAPGPLDRETVRAGFDLLWEEHDHRAIAALLMRYLAQPLDDSHTAWAYFFLSNGLAVSGEAAGAVLAFEAFERWLPGRSPRLSVHWPHDPLPDGAQGDAYDNADDVLLLSLGKSGEFALAWRGVWRGDEYLAKVDAALARIPPTPRNTEPRFACLRMACMLCETGGRFERAGGYVAQMYALAGEPERETERAFWRAKALGHDIGLRRSQGDAEGALEKVREMAHLLAAHDGAGWIRGERHELGHQFIWLGRHGDALPLFEANLASGGHVNDWGYFMHAAVLWKVTGNRARTLSLLRDASAYGNRDRTEELRRRPEFADLKDDPEFLAAVRKPE
jgi:RNA polymerase sigma factor (sigma-70 family)